jgi:hypothetical protein
MEEFALFVIACNMKSGILPFANKAVYFVTSPEDHLVNAGVCVGEGWLLKNRK